MSEHQSKTEEAVNNMVVENTINNLLSIINLAADGILTQQDLNNLKFRAQLSANKAIKILNQ